MPFVGEPIGAQWNERFHTEAKTDAWSKNDSQSLQEISIVERKGSAQRKDALGNSSQRPELHGRQIKDARQSFSSDALPPGVMQVTTDAREKILQSQREAALRRRKQQFQSYFINELWGSHRTRAT